MGIKRQALKRNRRRYRVTFVAGGCAPQRLLARRAEIAAHILSLCEPDDVPVNGDVQPTHPLSDDTGPPCAPTANSAAPCENEGRPGRVEFRRWLMWQTLVLAGALWVRTNGKE